MRERKSFYKLICIFVLLIPINNSFEVLAMLNGSLPYNGWSLQLTPAYIKIYKDLFTFIFLMLTIYLILRSKETRFLLKRQALLPMYLFIMIILLSFSGTLILGDPMDALVGLRGFSCLIYFFLGISVCRIIKMTYLNFCMIFILFLQLLLQIYEYINRAGVPVFGELRSPGVFIVPATAGLFANLTVCLFVLQKKKKLLPLSLLSIFLSNSTAGLLSVFLSLQYGLINTFSKKSKALKFILIISIIPFALFFVFLNISALSNRGEGITSTLLSRFYILTNYFSTVSITDFLFGGRFGQVTAYAVLDNSSTSFIADNTFLGLCVSMGVFSSIFFILFLIRFYMLDKYKILSFSMILFGLTANIFDLSPVSQLLFLLVGIVWGQHMIEKYIDNQDRN